MIGGHPEKVRPTRAYHPAVDCPRECSFSPVGPLRRKHEQLLVSAPSKRHRSRIFTQWRVVVWARVSLTAKRDCNSWPESAGWVACDVSLSQEAGYCDAHRQRRRRRDGCGDGF